MTILNTTFVVADHLMESFLDWARLIYIPALNDADLFETPTMAKVLAQVEPGATSVAIQTKCNDIEAATRWHDETAVALQEKLRIKFSNQVLSFTTYMEVLE